MAPTHIPKPIIGYATFLALFALGMGVWVWLAPDSFLAAGSMTLEGTGKEVVLFIFSARNLAFGTLFAIAVLFFRRRDVLLTIFAARLVVDIFDTLGMISAESFQLNTVTLISQFAVFLLPISACLYVLWNLEQRAR